MARGIRARRPFENATRPSPLRFVQACWKLPTKARSVSERGFFSNSPSEPCSTKAPILLIETEKPPGINVEPGEPSRPW